MSNNNISIPNNKNANEWTDWIEEAINKKYFKYYEYKHFSNVQEIGIGGFAKVFRATWKNDLEQYLVLKSFSRLNSATVKEIVREVTMKYNTHFFYIYSCILAKIQSFII
jgi:hypothetical protein